MGIIHTIRHSAHKNKSGVKAHGRGYVQGLLNVLEANYGGDITKMPYVVNKEAFAK